MEHLPNKGDAWREKITHVLYSDDVPREREDRLSLSQLLPPLPPARRVNVANLQQSVPCNRRRVLTIQRRLGRIIQATAADPLGTLHIDFSECDVATARTIVEALKKEVGTPFWLHVTGA